MLASVIGLPTSKVPLWRINYAIVGIPAILQAFLITTCVDSPRWLVSVNRIEDARYALQKLRGKNASIDGELYEIVENQIGPAAAASTIRKNDGDVEMKKSPSPALEDQALEPTATPESEDIHENLSLIGIFKDSLVRRVTIVVLSLHFIQQWIGMNAVILYSTTIFASAFDSSMSQYLAIATTGMNFVATLASVLLVDRMGRRPLLLIAEAGCTIFSVLLVIGYRFNVSGLLIASVFLYVASFAIGIGPIPWVSSILNLEIFMFAHTSPSH